MATVREPAPWRAWVMGAPVTLGLLAAMVVVWVVSLGDSSVAESWMLFGPYVAEGQWWRVLTVALLHAGAGHLIANGVLFFFLGRMIEQYLGSALYALACVTGAVGSSAAVLAMDYATPTVGASGMVFALMVMLVTVVIRRGEQIGGILALIAVNVGYTFIGEGISVWGHIGGLVTGAFLAAAVYPRRVQARWAGVAVVLVCAALACAQ